MSHLILENIIAGEKSAIGKLTLQSSNPITQKIYLGWHRCYKAICPTYLFPKYAEYFASTCITTAQSTQNFANHKR